MSANAFSPQENLTAALAVTSTSTVAPIQVKATVRQGAMTQRAFYNAGPNDCFVAATSPAAKAVAVVPTAGAPALGFPIPAGALVVYSHPPNTFFAAICAAGKTATLFIVVGEGN